MAEGIVWRGDQIQAQIRRGSERKLDRMGEIILKRLRVLISVPGSGGFAGRDVAGRFIRGERASGSRRQGASRSRPGEPPRLQTGRLRRGYKVVRPRNSVRRIGTDVPYAVYLEKGTRRMQPRPHLVPALNDTREAVRAEWFRQIRLT